MGIIIDTFVSGGFWSIAVTALGVAFIGLGIAQLRRGSDRRLATPIIATGVTMALVAALGMGLGWVELLSALDACPTEDIPTLTRYGLTATINLMIVALAFAVPGTMLGGAALHRADG